MKSAEEIRRKLIRDAGIQTSEDALTGIVAIVAPYPAVEIIEEIKKPEPSKNPIVRIIRDYQLGFVEKAFQCPNKRSMSLTTLDPEKAAALLEGFVDYVHVDVPLVWGTMEQRMERAWEQVSEWRREAQRALSNKSFNPLPKAVAPQLPPSAEYSEYPPSPRRRRPKPYLHLLGGLQTVQ